jgi:hypothetical protein
MRNKYQSAQAHFIPPDVQKIMERIRRTWTKLTEHDVIYYLEGNRSQFLAELQKKYFFSNEEQADAILSCIERLT